MSHISTGYYPTHITVPRTQEGIQILKYAISIYDLFTKENECVELGILDMNCLAIIIEHNQLHLITINKQTSIPIYMINNIYFKLPSFIHYEDFIPGTYIDSDSDIFIDGCIIIHKNKHNGPIHEFTNMSGGEHSLLDDLYNTFTLFQNNPEYITDPYYIIEILHKYELILENKEDEAQTCTPTHSKYSVITVKQ